MAFFGKYVPVSILFHELGHWIEYVGHYEKDYDLYGKDIVYAHGHIGDYVLAYDFTEAKAWVYGAFAARIIDNSSGSVHYYSCLEQMCYENSSDNFQRPVSDLAVYMLQRGVVSIKTKKSKKPLAAILKHARPIIDVLEAEAFRNADHQKDISVLLKREPDRFEIEDDWF